MFYCSFGQGVSVQMFNQLNLHKALYFMDGYVNLGVIAYVSNVFIGRVIRTICCKPLSVNGIYCFLFCCD
jgi:hypothetical protein